MTESSLCGITPEDAAYIAGLASTLHLVHISISTRFSCIFCLFPPSGFGCSEHPGCWNRSRHFPSDRSSVRVTWKAMLSQTEGIGHEVKGKIRHPPSDCGLTDSLWYEHSKELGSNDSKMTMKWCFDLNKRQLPFRISVTEKSIISPVVTNYSRNSIY